MIVELNNENFTKETSHGLKLVDFYTTWCSYCKNQNPILEELSENGMWIGKLDCDKYPDIAKKFGISGFPSFILFKDGIASAQFAGFHNKSQMLNKLTSYL